MTGNASRSKSLSPLFSGSRKKHKAGRTLGPNGTRQRRDDTFRVVHDVE